MEDELLEMEKKRARTVFDELRKEILATANSVMKLHSMEVYYAIERMFELQEIGHYKGLDPFEEKIAEYVEDGGVREKFLSECRLVNFLHDDCIKKMLEIYEKYPHNDLNDYIYLIYMRAIDLIFKGTFKDTYRFIIMSLVPFEYRKKFEAILEKRGV